MKYISRLIFGSIIVLALTVGCTLSATSPEPWWKNLHFREQIWPSNRSRRIIIFMCPTAEKARDFSREINSQAAQSTDFYDNSFNCEELEVISNEPYVSELGNAIPGFIIITDRQSLTFRVLPSYNVKITFH